jgi:RNA polymerase sigma factor (sigma-70 family)
MVGSPSSASDARAGSRLTDLVMGRLEPRQETDSNRGSPKKCTRTTDGEHYKDAMNKNPLGTVVRHLRIRAGLAAGQSSADGQLVSRFVDSHDENAFEEIVRRHGPLVWALCRTGLQAADAEDAFQATFVVLARRAANIRNCGSLACWLSGVARRVVAAARMRATRRPSQLADDSQPMDSSTDDRNRREWREVLDQEIDRLPDKYRLPILLCYYQGLTNEEAAARLGWRHGTVCGRLARARELLRRRLAIRSLTLGIGAFAIHSVGPPSDLIAATLGAGVQVATASAIASTVRGSALQLAAGALHTMLVEKIRLWTIGAAGFVALGGAVAWKFAPANAQSSQPAAVTLVHPSIIPPKPRMSREELDAELKQLKNNELKPSALVRFNGNSMVFNVNDDELQKFIKQRYQSAHDELTARMAAFVTGTTQGTIDILLECVTKHYLVAELSLSDRPKDRLTAYTRSLAILKFIEAVNQERFNSGRITIQDLEQSRFERLSLEIKMLETQRAVNGQPASGPGRP